MDDILGEFRNIAETLFNDAAGSLTEPRQQLSAQKVFFSVCYGRQRAKTVKGIGNTLRAAFDAALERALKIVSQKEALPKWVMVNIVEKEIPCPTAEYYDILNRIKPGYLRYGVSFDNRYATVFLEQEIYAASMIKYGKNKHTLDAEKITEYMRNQGVGGTGVKFSAPKMDSPVILFEVKSGFYDNGEYFEIDSSPASLRAGQRIVNFDEKPELRVETARRVVAACFTADCGTESLAGGFLDANIQPQKGGGGGTPQPNAENVSPTVAPNVSNLNSGDDAARFSAALPSVIFPEMAMFFESPETAAYGVYVRGKNLYGRDREAARFFTDYYNRYKNSVQAGGGTETEPKIIITRYNPYAHKIAEAYGFAANEFENMYDFFQNARNVEAREIEQDGAEKIVVDSAKKREKHSIYDCRGFLSCERLITSEERLVVSETFFTPSGERVLEKAYRVENGTSEIMVVRVKFEGTWHCFSDEGELFAFYSEKSAAQRGVPPVIKETHVDNMIQSTPEGLTLSIIIPHYNRAELILMCLDSIAVNDYPQELYEVIVVDDCSTENTDAVRGYSKIKNFRVCQLEKNSGGASAPRNYGITLAKGEYALFVDSDDLISSRLLSKSMEIARAGGCDAVIIPKISQRSTAAAFRTLTDDLTKIKLDGLSDLSVLVASDNYAIGKLFRMEPVRRFGIHFPENLVYSEDTCFCRWFYAVSKTMGICASESYFLRDWDGGTLSYHTMSNSEIYEHVSFITRNIFSVPDEFAPIDKKARAMDGSIKHDGVRSTLNTPYYAALLKEKYGGCFAAMKDAPRITKETREFIDAVIQAKPLARSRDKLEIVFMPYKASMWDSLESIYLAAKNDPTCDALVMPIPYYDKKDGKFTEMHLETDYPPNIPLTDYREYKIEERHPDIIYIHNPYDSHNHVTNVHPDFYSERLRNLTDCLVYVPYFVGNGTNMGVQGCTLPACIFAHKVIVQNEHIRQIYIREYKKLAENNNILERVDKAGEKFIALGSPKLDKAINTKREDCEIPEEWEKLIRKPDGTRKKVIFYNTSIVALLANSVRDGKPSDEYLRKIRSVFEFFKKREDAVLLWRPHPLLGSTIDSMRSWLAGEYAEIVREFKSGGYGIYDDSPDLYRAFACSDAYYGDASSVMLMFGIAGKPIMIQDAARKNENSGNLMFYSVRDDGENFWFTVENINALFKMDKQKWAAEYMGSFPKEMSRWGLYREVIEHDGKLYFTPMRADEIAVYDIASGRFEKISFAEPKNCIKKNDYNPRVSFCAAAAYGKYIFFIGHGYPAIMRLDTESGGLDYFTDWVEPLDKISDGDGYYFYHACVSGNKIFLPAINANAVAEFDMDRCVTRVYEVGSKGQKYFNICFDGINCWLIPRFDGAVVRWNPDTKEYKEYGGYPAGFKSGKPPYMSFGAIKYWDGYIWLLPHYANMALKIDVSDGSMSAAEEFMGECKFNGEGVFKWNYYFIHLAAGDKLYAHTGKTNRFMEYDFKTKQRREEGIALSEEAAQKLNENYQALFYKNVKRHLSVDDCYFCETPATPLQGFLNYVVNESEDKAALSAKQIEAYGEAAANIDGTCGVKIHEYVKKEGKL